MSPQTIRPLSVANRAEVLVRLRRIEGQVRGIQRMVEEGRDCREIVHQVAAIRAALNSLNGIVLECYAHNCLDESDSTRATNVTELIDILIKSTR